jgi:hypothetical protein
VMNLLQGQNVILHQKYVFCMYVSVRDVDGKKGEGRD